MKRILLFITIFFSIIGCKDQQDDFINDDKRNSISSLRADFEKQTGYHQKDSNFLFQSFKTSINWEQNKIVSDDTVYVKVNVLDKVSLLSTDSKQISINKLVWIKAVKVKDVWAYTLLTFIPENTKKGYTGAIISKSILSGDQWKAKYIEGKLVKQASGLRSSSTERKCTYGYVNGELNVISCEPPRTGTDYPGQGGGPIDYETVDPMEHGGAGGSSAGDGESTNNPTEGEIKEQIKDKPFALIPNIPCDIIKKWIATAKFTVDQTTENKLRAMENIIKPGSYNSYLTNIQNINNAYSTVVNMDYFPIDVRTLPVVNGKRLTPEQFIGHIRKNINSFIDTDYSEFKPYVYSGVNETNLWNSANPKNAVVAIDIGAPDNGSVIVSNYNSSGWTFTTIFEPMYGQHPVSGNRDFGFTKNSNGSYTFFTKGVDRLTSLDLTIIQNATGIPFSKADALWTSFQKGVADFVNKNGGNAGASKQEIYRPNWDQVKAVIDGKAPLSSLSTDCK